QGADARCRASGSAGYDQASDFGRDGFCWASASDEASAAQAWHSSAHAGLKRSLRACSKSRPVWLQMAIFCVPVLTYFEYAPLRYSKITIFAHTCRFLIQALNSKRRSRSFAFL